MRMFINFFLLLLIACYLSLVTPSVVYAQGPTPGEWIGDCVVNTPEAGEVATLQGFECLFRNIVRVLTPIAGLAVFIMLIVGAFQLMTAGGEPKQVQKARKTLTSAILGLFIFAGIFLVLKLIQAITGVDVTRFEIPK